MYYIWKRRQVSKAEPPEITQRVVGGNALLSPPSSSGVVCHCSKALCPYHMYIPYIQLTSLYRPISHVYHMYIPSQYGYYATSDL